MNQNHGRNLLCKSVSLICVIVLLLSVVLPVSAEKMTKADKQNLLDDTLNQLESWFCETHESVEEEVEELEPLLDSFDKLERFGDSDKLSLYVQYLIIVLQSDFEEDDYKLIGKYLSKEKNQKAIDEVRANNDIDIPSVEDLLLYAKGRQAEMEGRLDDAIGAYEECDFYDSYDRYESLHNSKNAAIFAKAKALYDSGMANNNSKELCDAYFMFQQIMDYDELCESYMDLIEEALHRVPTPDETGYLFVDSAIESTVRETLGKPKDDLFEYDLNQIKTLEINERGISDITDLKVLTNLKTVIMKENEISDLSPLANLTKLTKLILSDNSITDISPLKSLTKLKKLELDKNEVKDVSPLSALTNLEILDLKSNQISDISSLGSLKQLTQLELDKNKIADISAVASLSELTTLTLSNNQIANLDPLKKLKSLEALNASSNQISSVKPLKDLTNLKTLNLKSNSIKDISPLKGLKKLQTLNILKNRVTDVSSVSFVPDLKWSKASAKKQEKEEKWPILDLLSDAKSVKKKWKRQVYTLGGPGQNYPTTGGYRRKQVTKQKALFTENGYTYVIFTYLGKLKRGAYFPQGSVSEKKVYEVKDLTPLKGTVKRKIRPQRGPGPEKEYAAVEDIRKNNRKISTVLNAGDSVDVFFEVDGWFFVEITYEKVGALRYWLPIDAVTVQ